jgi:hypothetical protein
MTKYCPHCARALPRRAFHVKAGTWDGRQVWCKACTRAYQRRRDAQQHGYTAVGHDRLTAQAWPPAPREG